MTEKKHRIAEDFIGKSYELMDEHTQKVVTHIANKAHISKNTAHEFDKDISAGQRAADAVAKFGGSWAFIMFFALVLVCWVILNSYILANYNKAFDPYPYILLNLFLSMLASIQAPIILMSQNRQAEIDRLNAEHDYEVNLKAELEIMLLHEKIDTLREQQWEELIALQQQQLELLGNLIARHRP
ncbi:MAG: DUF1003 domain-containing protein [Methylophilus sp.]|nr:DUF1003 domain-containing protein [Methylophilus sp.]